MGKTARLAAAGIDQQAERERLVRLRGEVLDGLRLAVFQNVEIFFFEVGISNPCLSFTLKNMETTLTLRLKVVNGPWSSCCCWASGDCGGRLLRVLLLRCRKEGQGEHQ